MLTGSKSQMYAYILVKCLTLIKHNIIIMHSFGGQWDILIAQRAQCKHIFM